MPTPETKTEIPVQALELRELSPIAADLREEFIEQIKEITKGFSKDMDGGSVEGFGDRKQSLTSTRVDTLQAHILKQFYRLVDQMVDNFDRTLLELDKKYRAQVDEATQEPDKAKRDQAIAALEKEHKARCGRIRELNKMEITQLGDDVGQMGQHADNPSEFLRLYFPALEKLTVEQRTRSYEEVDAALKSGLIDVVYVQDTYGKAVTMLEKMDRKESLNEADYRELASQMSPFFATQFSVDDESKMADTMMGIERSGSLMVVHAMSPAERMTFGRFLIKDSTRTPDERRQSVLFLASANYISAAQVTVLLNEGGDVALLTTQEKTQIETAQKMLKALQKAAAKELQHSPKGNLIGDHFTASNALIYEVFGRIALIGMVISLGMNIKKPMDTLTSPIFVGMGAVAGLSYEHVSKGGISRMLAGGRVEKPRTKTPTEAGMEQLAGLMSDRPETVRFLRQDKGKMLRKVDDLAQISNASKKETYQFKFDDLIEDILEKENPNNQWSVAQIDRRRKELGDEYKKGLDGTTVSATEVAITNFYQTLRGPLGNTDINKMLAAMDQSEKEQGLI